LKLQKPFQLLEVTQEPIFILFQIREALFLNLLKDNLCLLSLALNQTFIWLSRINLLWHINESLLSFWFVLLFARIASMILPIILPLRLLIMMMKILIVMVMLLLVLSLEKWGAICLQSLLLGLVL